MLPQWIIEKKRNGEVLSTDELERFVGGYARGDIPDYQMAALAMAIFFQGMTPDETATLTRIMMNSGDVVDTSAIRLPKVDKHSTGGIGDKISIPLAPLVATCGVVVPMISGRGLGITGGTLDKLESIPGYRTALSVPEFISVLQSCGCSMIGQTDRIVPADRKLYALRDVTATVPSIPLIVSSIMSKKLAEGIDGLVLDVKCGRGAFMKTPVAARALAEALVHVGGAMGKRVTALITAMDQPLGRTVGNALEIVESVEILQGRGPSDTQELTLLLASEMLMLAGVVPTPEAARSLLLGKLESGEALDVFMKMVRLHGGQTDILEDPRRFSAAAIRRDYVSSTAGIVSGVDAEKIGWASLILGAGRAKTTDVIDPAAGLSGLVKIGERVEAGQPLAVLHSATCERVEEAIPLVRDAFVIGETLMTTPSLVLDRITLNMDMP